MNWNVTCYCISCMSLLKVENEDIKAKLYKSQNFYYTFRCPCCNIENEIISNIIPSSIKIISLKNLKSHLKGLKLYERFKI